MGFIISPIIFNGGAFALDTGLQKTAGAAGLPANNSIVIIIGQIIHIILGFLGVIFIILLIYGGFIRMTAAGNPETIKKSMGIITSAVIGIIIIIASYSITAFVLSRVGGSVGEGGAGETSAHCATEGEACTPAGGGNGYWVDDSGSCICVPE